jgi:hypothetical protein
VIAQYKEEKQEPKKKNPAMIPSRKEERKYRRREKRNSLFNRVIPHVYMGLNKREYKLIMERKY